MKFTSYKLDSLLRWVPADKENDGYGDFIPVIDKLVKSTRVSGQEQAIFKSFANGMNSARDDWAYDFTETQLKEKISFFSKAFNKVMKAARGMTYDDAAALIDPRIKWSRDLIKRAAAGRKILADKPIASVLYRPFSEKKAYFGDGVIDVPSLKSEFFPGTGEGNVAISINRNGKTFNALAIHTVPDWHFNGDTTYFGRYRYVDGGRFDNITDWALAKFRDEYNDDMLTKDQIFYYTYAVLNCPSFLDKYKDELISAMPRIPLMPEVRRWAKWGKELATLHSDFKRSKASEKVKLVQTRSKATEPILRFDPIESKVVLDGKTTICGLSNEVQLFTIGSRNLIEWVLEGYRPPVFTERDESQTVLADRFSEYPWIKIKRELIDLIPRLNTVAVRTVSIQGEMIAAELQDDA